MSRSSCSGSGRWRAPPLPVARRQAGQGARLWAGRLQGGGGWLRGARVWCAGGDRPGCRGGRVGAFWVEFLRALKRRGLAGVSLAISDQHEGLKGAIARVLGCAWQRCTVHFTRDMVMHCRRDQRGLVAAALREIFNAESHEQARERVTSVLERLQPVAPKVCELLEVAEEDLVACPRSRLSTGPNCAAPTRWSESTKRSAARRRRRDLPQRPGGNPTRRRAPFRAE